jgi:hypothetical protein
MIPKHIGVAMVRLFMIDDGRHYFAPHFGTHDTEGMIEQVLTAFSSPSYGVI